MPHADPAGQSGTSPLKLVAAPAPSGCEPDARRAAPVSLIESVVIDRAIADMDCWISDLPVASELRWSFLRAQRVLEAERAERRSRARTSARL
jgi:hypothetical protein